MTNGTCICAQRSENRIKKTNHRCISAHYFKNKKVLMDLVCALLHLKPEQGKNIEITNPINLAGDVSRKEFILDINILLNDDTQINLEM